MESQKLSHRKLVRISTAGSVDDGKSTLIGRFLHDCNALFDDQVESVEKYKDENGNVNYAMLLDGLSSEQEQGITIDVAYRFFSTDKRQFILADSPGHEQYTRNMVTATSTSNATIILLDAVKGVRQQSKRHAFITSLLKVPRVVVAVNKMDLLDFDQKKFESLKNEFQKYLSRLDLKSVTFIPISALLGDNVINKSTNMDWYHGPTMIDYFNDLYIESDHNLRDFRFPVQNVFRPDHEFRGYAGRIASGEIREGDEVLVLPSNRRSKVKSLHLYKDKLQKAVFPQSIVMTLEDEIDISRGDMICKVENVPRMETQFESVLVWMKEKKLKEGDVFFLKHTTQTVKAEVQEIRYKYDVTTLEKNRSAKDMDLNEIGRVIIQTQRPIYIDNYKSNKETGSFILIDPDDNHTMGGGMIIHKVPTSQLKNYESDLTKRREPKSENIFKEEMKGRKEKEKILGHTPKTIWFTGLSGSGKSSIAKELEKLFLQHNILTQRLDGDNLRFGLCNDLGFSKSDRKENIRRTAEAARLLNDAGVVAICSLISPFKAERENAEEIIGKEFFREIFVSTSLEECEKRDIKGLYKKARNGEILEFTGISSPYEKPQSPFIETDTLDKKVEDISKMIFEKIMSEIKK